MVDAVRYGNSAVLTLLALVVAMAVGAVLIAVADPDTRAASQYFFSAPMDMVSAAGRAVFGGYAALFHGAIYNPATASKGTLAGVLGPISETLVNATPLILGGLSVGLAFRAGLFNIGGQGQIIMGAIFAGYVGIRLAPAGGAAPARRHHRRHRRRRAVGRVWPGSSRLAPVRTRSLRRSCSTTWPSTSWAFCSGSRVSSVRPTGRPSATWLTAAPGSRLCWATGCASTPGSSWRCWQPLACGGCFLEAPSASSCVPWAPTSSPPARQA